MAFDGFIRIDGIEGESTDGRFQGCIELIDYDLNLGQKVSRTASSAGGASAERSDFSVFSFSKLLDKASPQLALSCASGTHIDNIVVTLCRSGKEKVPFMQYTFGNCMITSFVTTGRSRYPEDEVAFSFGSIEWRYTRQSRKGGAASGQAAAGWSLQRNCRM
jgi:type VI secretion system secreted protein Hcp